MKTLKPKNIADRSDPFLRLMEREGATAIIMDTFTDEDGNVVQRVENSNTGVQTFMNPVSGQDWAYRVWDDAEATLLRHKPDSRVYRRSTNKIAHKFYFFEKPIAPMKLGSEDEDHAALRAAKAGFALFRFRFHDDGQFDFGHPYDKDLKGYPIGTVFPFTGTDENGEQRSVLAYVMGDEFADKVVALERKHLSHLVLSWKEAEDRARKRLNEPRDTYMTEEGEIVESGRVNIGVFLETDVNEDFPDGWSH